MIKIKDTKSIEMYYGSETIGLIIKRGINFEQVSIPMKSIFQVQRGLTSAIQRFYRIKK